MARRWGNVWPVAWPALIIGTSLAALGAATGGLLALAYRPTGLAYADALLLCPPGTTSGCPSDATRAIGGLMVAGAAVALGTGLACYTLLGWCDARMPRRDRPAHPLVELRFAELCRQHGFDAADRPLLRVGGRRAASVYGIGRRAGVVVPPALGRAPVRPVVFDPAVRDELVRLGTGRTGWASGLRGWPWLIAPGCAGLLWAVQAGGSALAVPDALVARLLLLAAAVTGLSVGLRALSRARPGRRRAAGWYAGIAAGTATGTGAVTVVSILWHLQPSTDPLLLVAAALVAMTGPLGLLVALVAGRVDALGAAPRRAGALLGTLAGLLLGAAVFPIGVGGAASGATALLPRPYTGPAGPPPHSSPTAGITTIESDRHRAPVGARGASSPAVPGPGPSGTPVAAGVDTGAANRAARVIEELLDPGWSADPLPATASPTAGCHPSVIEGYLRSIIAHQTGHGVARYASPAPPATAGLGRVTLQVDVMSYRTPVDLVFAAADRAATACREFTDDHSGLRVQAITRPAPSAGDRAWRVDLVQTLGRGAGRVTATTALGLAQVDSTVVVVTMTASLAPVDGRLFDETLRRTAAELAGDRHDPAPGVDHLNRPHPLGEVEAERRAAGIGVDVQEGPPPAAGGVGGERPAQQQPAQAAPLPVGSNREQPHVSAAFVLDERVAYAYAIATGSASA